MYIAPLDLKPGGRAGISFEKSQEELADKEYAVKAAPKRVFKQERAPNLSSSTAALVWSDAELQPLLGERGTFKRATEQKRLLHNRTAAELGQHLPMPVFDNGGTAPYVFEDHCIALHAVAGVCARVCVCVCA